MIADIKNIIFPVRTIVIITGVIERIIADTCNTVRDCDAYKAFARIERLIADACNTVGDCDAC
jgi:hypothetical protein